jgi:hypothetical protein
MHYIGYAMIDGHGLLTMAVRQNLDEAFKSDRGGLVWNWSQRCHRKRLKAITTISKLKTDRRNVHVGFNVNCCES